MVIDILCDICHMIFFYLSSIFNICQISETELISHVQAAFHMEDDKHEQLFDIATMKEVSPTFIMLWIFSASDDWVIMLLDCRCVCSACGGGGNSILVTPAKHIANACRKKAYRKKRLFDKIVIHMLKISNRQNT